MFKVCRNGLASLNVERRTSNEVFFMSEPLYITFMWHMHQPYYKDPVKGEYALPWTYLHAVKDYYDMAAIVDETPGAKAVFNLVPSLLEQIEDYAAGTASDPFLVRGQMAPADMGGGGPALCPGKFFFRQQAADDRAVPALSRTPVPGGRRRHQERLPTGCGTSRTRTCSIFRSGSFWPGPAKRRDVTIPALQELIGKGKNYHRRRTRRSSLTRTGKFSRG